MRRCLLRTIEVPTGHSARRHSSTPRPETLGRRISPDPLVMAKGGSGQSSHRSCGLLDRRPMPRSSARLADLARIHRGPISAQRPPWRRKFRGRVGGVESLSFEPGPSGYASDGQLHQARNASEDGRPRPIASLALRVGATGALGEREPLNLGPMPPSTAARGSTTPGTPPATLRTRGRDGPCGVRIHCRRKLPRH